MRRPFFSWLTHAKRLLRADSGVAAVEFALILPIMVFVYVGTLDGSLLITTDRKVQSAAGAVGDLVARADETLTTSQLRDFFLAASGIMTPYSTTRLEQVVTAVRVDEDGDTEVVWTRQYADGELSSTTRHTVGDTYPLPSEMIDISLGRMVIASEASYTYTPVAALVFSAPINLYRSSFFMPRFGGEIALLP
jgi:Flp pilus assembly protein TadG